MANNTAFEQTLADNINTEIGDQILATPGKNSVTLITTDKQGNLQEYKVFCKDGHIIKFANTYGNADSFFTKTKRDVLEKYVDLLNYVSDIEGRKATLDDLFKLFEDEDFLKKNIEALDKYLAGNSGTTNKATDEQANTLSWFKLHIQPDQKELSNEAIKGLVKNLKVLLKTQNTAHVEDVTLTNLENVLLSAE